VSNLAFSKTKQSARLSETGLGKHKRLLGAMLSSSLAAAGGLGLRPVDLTKVSWSTQSFTYKGQIEVLELKSSQTEDLRYLVQTSTKKLEVSTKQPLKLHHHYNVRVTSDGFTTKILAEPS